MSLFKRRKAAADEAPEPTSEQLVEPDGPDAPEGDAAAAGSVGADPSEASERSVTFDRSNGPFDSTEVDGAEGRLELGALYLPLVEGVELQLQMDEGTQQVTGIFVILGESAVQLQAFAAPRSEGIWREIRDEIAAGITSQGGTADPGYGRFGRELLARVPATQPDGRTGFQPLRFAGVDGPRWLLRAVFHGRAAIEPDAARPLEDLVSQVVVNRGTEPMGPRELLPLQLPVEVQLAEGEGAPDVDAGAPDAGLQPERIAENAPAETFDDLTPFERGPEITERR